MSGEIENPGNVKIPFEGTLSDAINVSGPRKVLPGSIFLVRYNQDGSVINEKIPFSYSAKRGSKRNPYLIEEDQITVRRGLLKQTTKVLREVTAPFIGIYTARELLNNF